MAKQKQPLSESALAAERILIEKYFNDSEIKLAKTAPYPVEFLREMAVKSRRGMGGGKGIFFETMTGGKVEIYVAPDEFGKTSPTLVMTLKNLAQKVVANFEQKQPAVTGAAAVIQIETSRIAVCPFEPQARRRAKFKPETLESLASSIKAHGLVQPILVRETKKNRFEIVFGERRFLAFKQTGNTLIDCFVRRLTDAEVIELQYEENHEREDNTPLDDAFTFRFLKKEHLYTDQELSDRLNTSLKNVRDKLMLNWLIPDAVTELSDGALPLKHAYFLAKFPAETQRVICQGQYAYKYHDRSEKAVSFQTFVEEVETGITRRLDAAPFSTIDTRLHIKNLICPDCTERTGYAPALFTDLTRGDACLNRSCFEIKTNTHLRLKREEIAALRPNSVHASVEETAKEVPLVTSRDWTSDKTPFAEKVLTGQEFLEEPECEFSELSLIVEGARKGQQTYICRSDSCEVHHPLITAEGADAEKQNAELERKILQLTREKVLAASLDFFTDYKPVWMFDDLIRKLLLDQWNACGFDVRRLIMRIIQDWKDVPRATSIERDVVNFISSLTKQKQSQLLFLFIFKSAASEDDLKKLADEYAGRNYLLFEAEARLELAAPEDRELAEDILISRKSSLNLMRPPDHDLGDAAQ